MFFRILFILFLSSSTCASAQDSTQVLLEKLLSKSFGEKIKGTIFESRIESIRKKLAYNKILSSRIDSLTNVVAQSKFSSADSLLFSQILLSAVNDSSGDTYSSVRKIPSEKALALNRIYALSKLYEIDRKYSTNFLEIKPFIWFDNPSYIRKDPEVSSSKLIQGCMQEVRLMHLKSGSTIADIGAGTAPIEKALTGYLDSLTVYATELDTSFFNSLCNELLKLQLKDSSSNKFIPIHGSNTKTGLPDNSCDAIIIRNAFHHFDHPNEMLLDIKRTLKKNGMVYIIEIFSDETTKTPACDKHFTRAIFNSYLSPNGFKQTEELTLPGRDFRILVFQL